MSETLESVDISQNTKIESMKALQDLKTVDGDFRISLNGEGVKSVDGLPPQRIGPSGQPVLL